MMRVNSGVGSLLPLQQALNMAGSGRGTVSINVEECKGCALCVDSCPPHCLELAPELSALGVHPARYTGHGCTGCGICFYCCPEPGAITVYRLIALSQGAAEGTASARTL
jgi:2-oxoglutarate ferredoxin oxidoreductase subunit delta